MNGVWSGVNLADALVRVSCGDEIGVVERGRDGVRTHLLLMALLTMGARGRGAVLRELMLAACGRSLYGDGIEELLPLRVDPIGAIPLGIVLTRVLGNPASARELSARTVASYSLGVDGMRRILDVRRE